MVMTPKIVGGSCAFVLCVGLSCAYATHPEPRQPSRMIEALRAIKI